MLGRGRKDRDQIDIGHRQDLVGCVGYSRNPKAKRRCLGGRTSS